MANLLTIILAAGQGTRMKSAKIKVLHSVAGKPMLKHVLDNVVSLSFRMVVIVGYQGDEVRKSLNLSQLDFVEQKEQLGTGHAVLQARDIINEHDGPVLVLYGDTPLLRTDTLDKLVKTQSETGAAAVVLTANMEDPTGYGRIIRNNEGQVLKIIEEKDATPTEKEIREINSGVYCFDSRLLSEGLVTLDNDNAQGEYYLTDIIEFIVKKGKKVLPVVVNDSREIIGVNDRIQLACAEKVLRKRINQQHMIDGVTIIDQETTYIDSEVEIGQDTMIYPFTYLEGKTRIGSNTIIGAHCRITDGIIGNNVNLKDHCIIMDSKLGDSTTIGPFAYIRPGCVVAERARVGDFVEMKKALIGEGTKVPHLSYVGDTEIGKNTNIGAGTIFANYDGQEKHRTIVGNNVFIGSNSTLIAPLKVGDHGKTGAGSVVTRDIPENTTVIGVPAKIFHKKKGGKENN
jgi:bifunctional UDP-N-acetylglucosamine pyrophosphorylase/glucosamine-1-phosphate N-acetyltransferase